nr:PilW family protein [uncultured Rhodoferax sp.]
MPSRHYQTQQQKSSHRGNTGATLIELLIGIVIGLLVVIAAIGSLSFTKITAVTVSESTQLQQKADVIFRNMGLHLAQAGSIELTPSIGDSAWVNFSSSYLGYKPATTGATTSGAAKMIYSIHGVNGAGTASSTSPDTLRVSYQNNGNSRDCLGNSPTGTNVDNEFSVSNQELMCLGATNTAAQSIASGVEDFQVLYGIRSGEQFRYYRADEMLGPNLIPNWDKVQSVSICLQVIGESQGNPQPGVNFTGCRGQTIDSDGRLREVYRRTFSLRNAIP